MKHIVNKEIDLTVVVTIYNLEQIIPILIDQIKSNLNTLSISYEIILVDDGSTDKSLLSIELEAKKDNRVKSIVLSKNFGQQICASAGINYAKGKYVLIMDGDLQNPPEEIPNLYKKISEGFDIVYTRSTQKNDLIDSFTSFLFWNFLKKILKINIVDSQLMMKIMTAEVVKHFNLYYEKTRTIAAITNDIGMKTHVLNIKNKKRIIGKSNYNIKKRMNLAIDVILDLSQNPLNFIFNISLYGIIISFFLTFYYIYSYFSNKLLPGFTSTVILIVFFGSINLFGIGVIARYLSNIYLEVKKRPLYIVKKFINININKNEK